MKNLLMAILLVAFLSGASPASKPPSLKQQVAQGSHIETIVTTDTTETTVMLIEPIEDTITAVRVRVICRRPSDNRGKVWTFEFAARRTGTGNVQFVATPINTLTFGDTELILCTAQIDSPGVHYRIRVTGLASTELHWAAEDVVLILSP